MKTKTVRRIKDIAVLDTPYGYKLQVHYIDKIPISRDPFI